MLNHEPFAFTPRGGPIVCSSFSLAFKGLATLLVTLALGWAWHMGSRGTLELSWASSGWLGAALCMMLYTQWFILTGKTTLDSRAIEQTWVWKKRVEFHELAYAKLIRVRGLEWLIAPRLYTKTFSNKLAIFYVTSDTMLAELGQLEVQLKQARQVR